VIVRQAVTRGRRTRWWVSLIVVWVIAVGYVGARIDRGWIPLDEGVLGHSAERVLVGELPHRDFDDVYTGGLSQADAQVFRWTGVRLINLRWAMFAVFLLWVPAVFFIATRFTGAAGGAIATLLCIVWSVPTYPAAMPSWYNLFFATFGTAALMRFTDTSQRRWIVIAGVFGGLSVLVKIVGLYYIAGALLFFVWHEYGVARGHESGAGDSADRVYAGVLTVGLAVFGLALIGLVHGLPSHARYLHFVMPGALLAAFVATTEWRHPPTVHSSARLRYLASLIGPLLLGVAVPTVVFLIPYVAAHAVGDLVHGVFIAPASRLEFAREPPVPLRTIGAAALWLLVLLPLHRVAHGRGARVRIMWVAMAAVAALVLLATARGGVAYADVWLAIRYAAPCTVVAGWLLLGRSRDSRPETRRRQEQVWLLLCMTALCSLIQVPYAGSYYILYFAPIAILAQLAIMTSQPGGTDTRHAIAAGFFLVFGLACVNPGHITVVGARIPEAEWPTVPLALPRTGLRSSPIASDRYTRVVQLLRDHTRPGGYTYAAPDCPELYYLAQLRDPMPTLFDFLDEPSGHDARVLRAFDSLAVTAVAINASPLFSRPIDTTLATALRTRFPDSTVIGNFTVRWRPVH
jgi:hypothetical protein